jgi:hypothetical protein
VANRVVEFVRGSSDQRPSSLVQKLPFSVILRDIYEDPWAFETFPKFRSGTSPMEITLISSRKTKYYVIISPMGTHAADATSYSFCPKVVVFGLEWIPGVGDVHLFGVTELT